jgi:hypothetical protein
VALLLAALEAARADPPRIVAGDAVDDLPALLDEVPPALGVCVTTSVMLGYLGDRRTASPMRWRRRAAAAPSPGWPSTPSTGSTASTPRPPGWARASSRALSTAR